MRLHQTYWATWKRLLSSLVSAQLTGEPVPRSGLLPPSSVDLGSSRARFPPLPFCSPGVLQMLLSNSASARPSGVVRPVLHQISATYCQNSYTPTQPLWRAALCFLLAKEENCFSVAEQHSLEPSIEQWRPKATDTAMPPPSTHTTQDTCMPRLARMTYSFNRAHRDFHPLVATPHHRRLLWNLWEWIYHFL